MEITAQRVTYKQLKLFEFSLISIRQTSPTLGHYWKSMEAIRNNNVIKEREYILKPTVTFKPAVKI